MSLQQTQLRSLFSIALLLSGEVHYVNARRVRVEGRLDSSESVKMSESNGTSTEVLPILYGLSAASGLYIPATAAVAPVASAATGFAVNWLGVGALGGAGMLVKPLVGRFIAKRATEAVVQTTVVAATRTNLIGMALSRVAPWAFAAGAVTPVGQGVFWLTNIALTGWQLFSLTKDLKSNPKKLCGLLKAMPMIPLADKCIPGGAWNPIPKVPDAPVPASWRQIVPPKVALAIIAAIVVAAGGYLLYKHVRMSAYNQAFCPQSVWKIDRRFYGEVPGTNTTDANGPHLPGMAHCKGYSRVVVQVDCAPDDTTCRHAACQTACCSTKNCIAYQFNNQAPWFAYVRPLVCYLTFEAVTQERCEAPWFGEERSNYDPGVDEPMWSMAGIWYPPDYETREETWSPSPLLSHQVYGLKAVSPPLLDDEELRPHLPACHPTPTDPVRMEQCEKEQCRLACVLETHCLFYQYQRKSVKQAGGIGVPADWRGVEKCLLGFSQNLETWGNWGKRVFPGLWKGDYDEEEVWSNAMKWSSIMSFQAKEWHGGERNRKDDSEGCKMGMYACPSSGNCVRACEDCSGFHLEGENKMCERSAEQSICDANAWKDTYRGKPLNGLKCHGLNYKGEQIEVVKLSEPTAMSAHDICREACCREEDCVLYQFDKRLADRSSFKEGSRVTCQLFKVDINSIPMFKCDAGASYEGGYLASRGCSDGKFACLTTNGCVDTCANGNCVGAPFNDDATSSCTSTDPRDVTVAQQNQIEMQKRHAISHVTYDDTVDNEDDVLGETPVIVDEDGGNTESESTSYTIEDAFDCTDPPCLELFDDSNATATTYYLVPDSPHESSFETTFSGVVAETIVKLEASSLIPPAHMGKVCQLLKVGAYSCGVTDDRLGCRCNFLTPQKCHPTFFHSERHIRVINLVAGTVMFAGDGCECHEEESEDQHYPCDFKVKDAIPKISVNREATFALKL